MPTQSYGYRYPADTEPTREGALGIQHLAEDVQTIAGIGASGSVNVVMNNASSGSTSVTFATDTVDGVAGVPRFTTPPVVVVSNASNRYWFGAVAAITNLGCTVYMRQYENTPNSMTITAHWIAREGA